MLETRGSAEGVIRACRRPAKVSGWIAVLLVAALIIMTACGTGAAASGTPDGGLTYAQLRDQLRALDASVQEGSSGSGGWLEGTVHFLTVNGAKINVYEYATTQAAAQDAAHISPDGSTITRTDSSGSGQGVAIDFIAPPHWFATGHVIVLYIGCDSTLMGHLQQVLGPPFAGEGTAGDPCPDPRQITPTP